MSKAAYIVSLVSAQLWAIAMLLFTVLYFELFTEIALIYSAIASIAWVIVITILIIRDRREKHE